MLDVHPPHTAVHGWRDFFIHIATIVIGLLIAVGIEQTVESFHHRHEARDAREALRLERETNHARYKIDTASFRRLQAVVRNNLSVLTYLRQHPGTPEATLPGVLVCGVPWIPPEESAWKAAQQTNATAYMAPSEVQSYSAVYYFLDQAFNQQIVANGSLSSACGFVLIDPNPTHLTPAQIDETIARMAGVQVEISKWVPYLATFGSIFPDFKDGPTRKEFSDYRDPDKERELHNATAITSDRLDTAAPDPFLYLLGK
jgi:hypothetical protein